MVFHVMVKSTDGLKGEEIVSRNLPLWLEIPEKGQISPAGKVEIVKPEIWPSWHLGAEHEYFIFYFLL